jgi:hypothetical protein
MTDIDEGDAITRLVRAAWSRSASRTKAAEVTVRAERQQLTIEAADAMRASSLRLTWDELMERLRKHRAFETLRLRSQYESEVLRLRATIASKRYRIELIHEADDHAVVTGYDTVEDPNGPFVRVEDLK